MTTYICLLRGINLGSHNRLSMPDFAASLTKAGFTEVRTYRQSGNAVFTSDLSSMDTSKAVHDILLADRKLDLPVLVLTAEELRSAALANPFLSREDIDTNALYATFLEAAPDPALLADIDRHIGGEDEWQAVGKTIYLYCPGGYGRTKLNNGFFERKLKQTATTRNWKTVSALRDLAEAS